MKELLSTYLTASGVTVWKKHREAECSPSTAERCPCRFPLSASDDCPRLPLSLSLCVTEFFWELSAVLFTDC